MGAGVGTEEMSHGGEGGGGYAAVREMTAKGESGRQQGVGGRWEGGRAQETYRRLITGERRRPAARQQKCQTDGGRKEIRL